MRCYFHLLAAALVGMILAPSLAAQDSLAPRVVALPALDVAAANQPSHFIVSASLLYLQPGSGNLEYGTLVHPLPAASPHWENRALEPGFSPAFDIGFSYLFAESSNDIRCHWTHLDTETTTASFVAGPTEFAGPPYQIGPDANTYNLANASVHYNYDAVNLDFGHRVSFGGPAQIRLFGGLQYASISQTLSAEFQSFDRAYYIGNTTESTFNGIGPRLGMQVDFSHGNFDLLAELAGSTLIGNMQSRLDFSAVDPNFAGLPNAQSLTSPDAVQVIPALQTKLGTGYTFRGRHSGRFRIEGGYQAAIYMNAINEYYISDVVLPAGVQQLGIFLRTQDHDQSDFTAHGPYLSATWTF